MQGKCFTNSGWIKVKHIRSSDGEVAGITATKFEFEAEEVRRSLLPAAVGRHTSVSTPTETQYHEQGPCALNNCDFCIGVN